MFDPNNPIVTIRVHDDVAGQHAFLARVPGLDDLYERERLLSKAADAEATVVGVPAYAGHVLDMIVGWDQIGFVKDGRPWDFDPEAENHEHEWKHLLWLYRPELVNGIAATLFDAARVIPGTGMDLTATEQTIRVADRIGGVVHEFRYARPDSEQRTEYASSMFERADGKLISRVLAARVAFGRLLLTTLTSKTIPADSTMDDLLAARPDICACVAQAVFESAAHGGSRMPEVPIVYEETARPLEL